MNKHQVPFSSHLADWTLQAQQRAFRQILHAFSYPGRIVEVETDAAHALPLVLATLVDPASTLADPHDLLGSADHKRLGAAVCAASKAQFVVMPGDRAPDFEPSCGTLDSPEQGATLVLVVDALSAEPELRLSGPGIQRQAALRASGLDAHWWTRRRQWNSGFPLGVDVVLIGGRSVVALPRTIKVTAEGDR